MGKKKTLCDCGEVYTPHKITRHGKTVCNDCFAGMDTKEIKLKAVEYLGGKCVGCSYGSAKNDILAILEFDHIDPKTKSFKISGNFHLRWIDIKKELDKCVLKCPTCHKARHYLEEQMGQ
jgi:hypothetical protein